MPPKKATTGAAKPKTATASHPPYSEMIKEAIVALKERNGSSRQAIKKYVQQNNNLGGASDKAFSVQFNKALQRGSESGLFARPKGTSGPVKLAAPKSSESKPATKTAKTATAKKPAAAKKPTVKKTTTTKPAATKKAPAKKTTTATKAKANTGKARKTAKAAPTAAPAVEEKAPVVLGKTKSGRVTKSKAPQPVRKSVAPKKAAAKKATPKKATPKKA